MTASPQPPPSEVARQARAARLRRATWAAGPLALGLALAGHLSPALAWIDLFTGLAWLAAAPLAAALAIVALVRRQPFAHLATFALCAGAAFALGSQVVFGVPGWVRWRAGPAIAALEQAAQKGPLPADESGLGPDLQRLLRESDCRYTREAGAPWQVRCLGMLFTECTWDSGARRWSTGD